MLVDRSPPSLSYVQPPIARRSSVCTSPGWSGHLILLHARMASGAMSEEPSEVDDDRRDSASGQIQFVDHHSAFWASQVTAVVDRSPRRAYRQRCGSRGQRRCGGMLVVAFHSRVLDDNQRVQSTSRRPCERRKLLASENGRVSEKRLY